MTRIVWGPVPMSVPIQRELEDTHRKGDPGRVAFLEASRIGVAVGSWGDSSGVAASAPGLSHLKPGRYGLDDQLG